MVLIEIEEGALVDIKTLLMGFAMVLESKPNLLKPTNAKIREQCEHNIKKIDRALTA